MRDSLRNFFAWWLFLGPGFHGVVVFIVFAFLFALPLTVAVGTRDKVLREIEKTQATMEAVENIGE